MAAKRQESSRKTKPPEGAPQTPSAHAAQATAEQSGPADLPTPAAVAPSTTGNGEPLPANHPEGPESSRQRFPVVGVGASAGGLEALQELFSNMPDDPGVAFVVVTHQHPGHVSLLPSLLSKNTKMPVVEAADAMRVEPNHVYVAPANPVAIVNGALRLAEIEPNRIPPMHIDYFFRSLASDLREQAICIILSGTGADGTQGLRAVKAELGMAMVQQPPSAKYDGMPSSAAGNDGRQPIISCPLRTCRGS